METIDYKVISLEGNNIIETGLRVLVAKMSKIFSIGNIGTHYSTTDCETFIFLEKSIQAQQLISNPNQLFKVKFDEYIEGNLTISGKKKKVYYHISYKKEEIKSKEIDSDSFVDLTDENGNFHNPFVCNYFSNFKINRISFSEETIEDTNIEWQNNILQICVKCPIDKETMVFVPNNSEENINDLNSICESEYFWSIISDFLSYYTKERDFDINLRNSLLGTCAKAIEKHGYISEEELKLIVNIFIIFVWSYYESKWIDIEFFDKAVLFENSFQYVDDYFFGWINY